MVSIGDGSLGCGGDRWFSCLGVEILVASRVKADDANTAQVAVAAKQAFGKPVIVALVRHGK